MQRGASWYSQKANQGMVIPLFQSNSRFSPFLHIWKWGFLGFPHPERDQAERKAESLQGGFHSQDIHCSVVSTLNFLILLSLDFCFLVNSEDKRAYSGNFQTDFSASEEILTTGLLPWE